MTKINVKLDKKAKEVVAKTADIGGDTPTPVEGTILPVRIKGKKFNPETLLELLIEKGYNVDTTLHNIFDFEAGLMFNYAFANKAYCPWFDIQSGCEGPVPTFNGNWVVYPDTEYTIRSILSHPDIVEFWAGQVLGKREGDSEDTPDYDEIYPILIIPVLWESSGISYIKYDTIPTDWLDKVFYND